MADANILAGALLWTKSSTLFFNAFNLGVEPVAFSEYIEDLQSPVNLEGLLIEYPNLLSGDPNIQAIFRSAYQNLALGSENIQMGLELMAQRETPQSVHLFYLDNVDDMHNMKRYMRLLDRTILGLLAVTGGDLNGDTKVDFWDLHDFQRMISPK